MTGEVVRLRRLAPDHEPPLSDDALARACAGRDPAAVAELFDRFQPRVTRYVRRLVRSQADVEDIVQSTFLEIARATAVYDGRAQVVTWLFAIATNVVRHHRRGTARRLRFLSTVASAPPPPAEPGTDAQADARRQLERAQTALDALDPDLREAFVLCELEGLPAREAAVALRISEAAVWKRTSRARDALRRAVNGASR